jgi:hypothetical protein
MPQPSLHGWIYGVPDNALYADAVPPNPPLTRASTGPIHNIYADALSPERVLTFASALTGFDLKAHNPTRDARFVTLSFPGWNHYRRNSMT